MEALLRQLSIDYHEIRHFEEGTKLRFNALCPVRQYVLGIRSGGREGELELWHWVVDDVWELVHSSLA